MDNGQTRLFNDKLRIFVSITLVEVPPTEYRKCTRFPKIWKEKRTKKCK